MSHKSYRKARSLDLKSLAKAGKLYLKVIDPLISDLVKSGKSVIPIY